MVLGILPRAALCLPWAIYLPPPWGSTQRIGTKLALVWERCAEKSEVNSIRWTAHRISLMTKALPLIKPREDGAPNSYGFASYFGQSSVVRERVQLAPVRYGKRHETTGASCSRSFVYSNQIHVSPVSGPIAQGLADGGDRAGKDRGTTEGGVSFAR